MFTGSIVALITPMYGNGMIDRTSLEKLINYHIISGTTAILVAGTTGEVYSLTPTEHYDIVMWSLEISNNRIPIIIGIGTNSTAKAISLTNSFSGTGISGYLNVVPYYNKPTQEGIYQHFAAIASNSDLPHIIYNVPSRTGCDITLSTIARLANIKNIIGIKDSSGDLSRVNKIKNIVDKKFILLSGHDATALDFIQLGGHGVISVTANIVAKEMVQIITLATNGHFTKARNLNQQLIPLHHKLFLESNPIPVKWACKRLGLIEHDTLRLPMTTLSKNNIFIIEKIMKNIGML